MQGAALKLAYMEYADLQLEERLALLQSLLEQALDCELVRDLITSKVEAMALPRQKKPVCYACCAALQPAAAAHLLQPQDTSCTQSDKSLTEDEHQSTIGKQACSHYATAHEFMC